MTWGVEDNMKYAFISGGASGLAQASIKELVKAGYTVFCADIAYKENKKEGNIHYIKMDITKDADIVAAFDYVKKVTDKLDILSNFAGIVTLGSLIELPINTLDRIMAINLLGTYKVNAVFYPLVQKAQGRIINISSEYGKITGLPFHGYYGISKHAIETYNESLRRELVSSGVKVICIRPGAFKTNMQAGVSNQFEKLEENTKLYKKQLSKMQGMMTKKKEKAKPAEIFAKVYMKAVTSRHPKRYYKTNNSLKMKMLAFMPTAMQDWAFKKYF